MTRTDTSRFYSGFREQFASLLAFRLRVAMRESDWCRREASPLVRSGAASGKFRPVRSDAGDHIARVVAAMIAAPRPRLLQVVTDYTRLSAVLAAVAQVTGKRLGRNILA